MKDLSKFEEYGRSLAERVAQGKFNKEKVEKTVRSKAKKSDELSALPKLLLRIRPQGLQRALIGDQGGT
jgi:hypothetical protein